MGQQGRVVFAGGAVITPNGVCGTDVVVADGKVAEIRDPRSPEAGEQVVDCSGLYVGPGLVDIHAHGGAGNDFVSTDPDEIARGVDYHLSQGTTSIAPSLLSVPFPQLAESIEATREAAKRTKATILGCHVEGVYLDKEYRGGHLLDYVHEPDPAEYEPLIDRHGDFITEWTLAVEMPGALDLIRACKQAGITASVGHSQASWEDMMAAIEAGLSHSTHFACVMGNLRFRPLRESTGKGFAPGVMETVLLDDRVSTEVIADGFHLHPGLIRLAYKCKGVKGCCIVSDSMKGAGLPDGMYEVGGQPCLVSGGIAIIADRPDVIASSVTPLSGMVRWAHIEAGILLSDAWNMASLTPARVVGFDSTKGSLEPGKDADILLLDRELAIRGVFVRGEKVA